MQNSEVFNLKVDILKIKRQEERKQHFQLQYIAQS